MRASNAAAPGRRRRSLRSAFRIAFGDIAERGLRGNLGLIRRNGLAWTAASLGRHAKTFLAHKLNVLQDRRLGIDTAGVIMLDELDLDSANKSRGVHYEPTSGKTFKQIMAHLPADLSRFTFVDFGSGKGRVLLLASAYGFRRIVGVEFARELHETACRNIEAFSGRARRCKDIQSRWIDAVAYRFDDDHYVLFFFCPFEADIVETVLANVNAALAGRRGHVYLCYVDEYWSTIVPTGSFERAGFRAKVGMTYVRRDVIAPKQLKFVIYERAYAPD